MNLFKKNVLSLSLIACLLVTAHAMAATCPAASDFQGLAEMGSQNDHTVWVKLGSDAQGHTVIYTVTTKANIFYQGVMASAQAHRLSCPGMPSSATVCTYTGPNLHRALGCNDMVSRDAFPVNTALVMIY